MHGCMHTFFSFRHSSILAHFLNTIQGIIFPLHFSRFFLIFLHFFFLNETGVLLPVLTLCFPLFFQIKTRYLLPIFFLYFHFFFIPIIFLTFWKIYTSLNHLLSHKRVLNGFLMISPVYIYYPRFNTFSCLIFCLTRPCHFFTRFSLPSLMSSRNIKTFIIILFLIQKKAVKNV